MLFQSGIYASIVNGVIGAIVGLLFDRFISIFRMKRKQYCISKYLISSSVYKQTDDDKLKIKVSYNDKEIDGPLSVFEIRLRNDGADDLMYSQRISRLSLGFNGIEVIDISVSSIIADVNPIIFSCKDGKYELKWDLLKKDESIYIKVVSKGEVKDLSVVKFEIRADGINQIKSPEYRVSEVMIPVLLAAATVALPIAVFYPASSSFIGIMPMKVLLLIVLAFMVILFWALALLEKNKWINEQ